MPDRSVHITLVQYNRMMLDFNQEFERRIVDDVIEYEYLGEVTNGLTPRIKVNLRENIGLIIRNILNNEHPIISTRLTATIMCSLDSAIYALFSIRPKNSFTPLEIKTYLYNHLEWLLDVRTHYPSIIGDYITVDEENIIETTTDE